MSASSKLGASHYRECSQLGPAIFKQRWLLTSDAGDMWFLGGERRQQAGQYHSRARG